MVHDEEEPPLDPKLTWPYLVQDIVDEIIRSKSSIIVGVIITLISVTVVSILPFFDGFWEVPYAVAILVFFGSFTIIPTMYFYILIFFRMKKKSRQRTSNT